MKTRSFQTPILRSGLRFLALGTLALALTAFSGCEDDALLDPEGDSGCNTHHCNPRIQPDVTDHENPARF